MIVSSAVRVLAATLVVPLLSLVPLAAPASAAAGAPPSDAVASRAGEEVKTKKLCDPAKYKTRYKIRSARRAPEITQIKAYFMPPMGRRKVTKTADFYLQLRSSVKLNSSTTIGASGIAKVLAKAEARVDMQLKASGKATARKKVKVTDWISNPTQKNQKFIFFKGWERASGGFRQYTCKFYYLPGKNYGAGYVTYRGGTWQSFNISGEGALRCGAGSPDAGLGKLALKVGC